LKCGARFRVKDGRWTGSVWRGFASVYCWECGALVATVQVGSEPGSLVVTRVTQEQGGARVSPLEPVAVMA